MTHTSTKTGSAAAGLDIGKDWLDLAVDRREERWRLPNTEEGRAELGTMLIRLGIGRTGLALRRAQQKR